MGEIPKVLSIAGTDPTGGAGIHADLKTFQEVGAYGMAVITSIVAQNTMGVKDVWHMEDETILKQLEAVFEDIRPQAVKTGMIALPSMIESVTARLEREKLPIIVDPVMVATSGDSLMDKETTELMINRLLPITEIVTPNMEEAEKLTGVNVSTIEEAEKAARVLVDDMGAEAAVVKGGHAKDTAVDVLYYKKEFVHLKAERFDTKHTHGTGCTFSAAIAANRAKGIPVIKSCELAKEFITKAISHPLNIGRGNGPVNHWGRSLEK